MKIVRTVKIKVNHHPKCPFGGSPDLPPEIEPKLPRIVKSSSSTEKDKLETLYSPNKGSPKVIENRAWSKMHNVKNG
jgi:hypothetical protein